MWSCGKCNVYSACLENVTNQPCDCIKGLPSDGTFCQPITSIDDCPPTPVPVFYSIVVDFSFPGSLVSPNLLENIKSQLSNVRFQPINSFLSITYINVTTTCFPMSDVDLQCQCEDQFLWSCDQCNIYGTCSNVTHKSCDCINGLPSDGSFCEAATNVNECPTTTPVFTTTTPMTTLPNPTTPMTTLPNTIVNLTLEFVLNINFNPSYNDEDNSVRNDLTTSIDIQSMEHIKDLVDVKFGTFREGSTIANFTIFANSEISPSQQENLLIGMFNNLSSKYPVIFDGSRFEPEEAFIGSPLTLTCDAPPELLDLGVNLTAVWLLNGEIIRHHTSSTNQNRSTTLSVPRVYNTDNGLYECQLRTPSNSRFRRRAAKFFTVQERPVIIVNQIQQLVNCDNPKVELECSVNEPYEVFFPNFLEQGTKFTYEPETCENQTIPCRVKGYEMFEKNIKLVFSNNTIICINDTFGNGTLNFKAAIDCEKEFEGERTAICKQSTKFEDFEDNCILRIIKNLLDQSENLTVFELPQFLRELSNATVSFSDQIVNSTATTNAVVEILQNIAELAGNTTIQRQMMEDVLLSAGILTTDGAREVWRSLNKVTLNTLETNISDPIRHLKSSSQSLLPSQSRTSDTSATSVSGSFLQALETITSRVANTTFNISTPSILLNKTTFSEAFSSGFNSSVEIDLPESDGDNVILTVVTFLTMDNVLPPRDEVNSSSNVINGRVVIVQSFSVVTNISFTFEVLNTSLDKPQCVFWNFSLFDGLGGWDGDGCKLVLNVNDTVTCNCNHLTSFSMLMSFGNFESLVLDYITYIGVSISLASLIICLIIEAVIWRKLRSDPLIHLRHISIVNIALSLLIADIWFLVGAAISGRGDTPACTAATFFIHLFYLALFFWMLSAALLLLYHVVDVFGPKVSKSAQIGIGFALGYGVPVIITVITIAVTAPDGEYIQRSGLCWLNIKDSLALLAFVVPALLIVLINLIILIVVIYKIVGLRGGSESMNKLKGIIKTLAVLTPLFGITWGLGVGIIVDPFNLGVHITFAIFNSLQGLFILIFGTLLDGTVRTEMSKMSSVTSGTRTTSNGNTSSGPSVFQRSRQSRGYNISSGTNVEAQSFNT
ncbi:adhesion G protein-coupled receptor F5 isoform X2 [Gouania willdenowi]|nr:adhesion G protein-coupled receptor F5-like isoform X2 [Gouania willdenowi]